MCDAEGGEGGDAGWGYAAGFTAAVDVGTTYGFGGVGEGVAA